jgi:NAD(P)-dependent dehydrogenase (short-subunit alcohol dehydrogenase family)
MQRVFITGASSGLGQALAVRYAADGAIVALVGRRRAQLEALQASLPNPGQHRIYALDVNDHAALAAAAADFMAAYDGVDVVIASAGVSQGTLTELAEDLPVFAPFIAAMKAQRGARRPAHPPRLVAIASVAGIRGLPGASAYSASKAAVISYCESLRVELHGTDIRVVTVVPGYIDTPMTRTNTYRMPFLMPADRFAEQAVQRGL